ncbi:MAG: hypothetical protein Q7T11_00680 [Deltaproteobacteria bacterium]|nr:hypothetical protein [Deltaproteobacteria bacterium]
MTAPKDLPILGECNVQAGQFPVPLPDASEEAIRKIVDRVTTDVSEPAGFCSKGETAYVLVNDHSDRNPTQAARLQLINDIVNAQSQNYADMAISTEVALLEADLSALKTELEADPNSDFLQALWAAVLGWASAVGIFGYGTHVAGDLLWKLQALKGIEQTNRFRLRVEGEISKLMVEGECTQVDTSTLKRASRITGNILRTLADIVGRKLAIAAGAGLAASAGYKAWLKRSGQDKNVMQDNPSAERAMREMEAFQDEAEATLMAMPLDALQGKYEEVTRERIRVSASAGISGAKKAELQRELAELHSKEDSTWLWLIGAAGSGMGTMHAFGWETERAKEILERFGWHHRLQDLNTSQRQLAREWAVKNFSALEAVGKIQCKDNQLPRDVAVWRHQRKMERVRELEQAPKPGAGEESAPVVTMAPQSGGELDTDGVLTSTGVENLHGENQVTDDGSWSVWPWVVGTGVVLGVGALIYFTGGAATPFVIAGGEATAGGTAAATTGTGVTLVLIKGGAATATVVAAETAATGTAVGLAKAAGIALTVGSASFLAASEARAEETESDYSEFYDETAGECVEP